MAEKSNPSVPTAVREGNPINESFVIVNGQWVQPPKDDNGHEVAQFHHLDAEHKEEGDIAAAPPAHEENKEEEEHQGDDKYQHEQKQKEVGEEVEEEEEVDEKEETQELTEESQPAHHTQEEEEKAEQTQLENEAEEEIQRNPHEEQLERERELEQELEREREREREKEREREREQEMEREKERKRKEDLELEALEKEREREREENLQRQRQRDEEERERQRKELENKIKRESDPKYMAEEFKLQGNDYFAKKDYVSAIDSYTKAIEIHQDGVFYSNRAACYIQQQNADYDMALQDATKAIELKPDFGRAHSRKAKALLGLKRYNEAKEYAIQAAKLDPKMESETDTTIKQINKEQTPVSVKIEGSGDASEIPEEKPDPIKLGLGRKLRIREGARHILKKTPVAPSKRVIEEDEEDEEEDTDEDKGEDEEDNEEGVYVKQKSASKQLILRRFWTFTFLGVGISAIVAIAMKLRK